MRQGARPLVRFALSRLAGLVAVLLTLLIVTFLIVRIVPGDPAVRIAGQDAEPEYIEQLRVDLGLDRPLHEQFVTYVTSVARFDFGKSFRTRQDVSDVILSRLPKTAELAGAALLLIVVLAVPVGVIAGAITRERRHPRVEFAYTASTSILGAMPEFLAATFLAFLFAVWLRLLPVAGASDPLAIVLPTVAIAIKPAATLSRVVRVQTLGALAQDYARTARSKRLPAHLFYGRHIAPNVLTGALTLGGLLFADLIGGAVIVENVFAWPGLGTALVQAVINRDYPVIQGIVLVLGVAIVLVNFVVDVLITLVDPRTVLTGSR